MANTRIPELPTYYRNLLTLESSPDKSRALFEGNPVFDEISFQPAQIHVDQIEPNDPTWEKVTRAPRLFSVQSKTPSVALEVTALKGSESEWRHFYGSRPDIAEKTRQQTAARLNDQELILRVADRVQEVVASAIEELRVVAVLDDLPELDDKKTLSAIPVQITRAEVLNKLFRSISYILDSEIGLGVRFHLTNAFVKQGSSSGDFAVWTVCKGSTVFALPRPGDVGTWTGGGHTIDGVEQNHYVLPTSRLQSAGAQSARRFVLEGQQNYRVYDMKRAEPLHQLQRRMVVLLEQLELVREIHALFEKNVSSKTIFATVRAKLDLRLLDYDKLIERLPSGYESFSTQIAHTKLCLLFVDSLEKDLGKRTTTSELLSKLTRLLTATAYQLDLFRLEECARVSSGIELPSQAQLQDNLRFQLQYVPGPERNENAIDRLQKQLFFRANYERITTERVNEELWTKLYLNDDVRKFLKKKRQESSLPKREPTLQDEIQFNGLLADSLILAGYSADLQEKIPGGVKDLSQTPRAQKLTAWIEALSTHPRQEIFSVVRQRVNLLLSGTPDPIFQNSYLNEVEMVDKSHLFEFFGLFKHEFGIADLQIEELVFLMQSLGKLNIPLLTWFRRELLVAKILMLLGNNPFGDNKIEKFKTYAHEQASALLQQCEKYIAGDPSVANSMQVIRSKVEGIRRARTQK